MHSRPSYGSVMENGDSMSASAKKKWSVLMKMMFVLAVGLAVVVVIETSRAYTRSQDADPRPWHMKLSAVFGDGSSVCPKYLGPDPGPCRGYFPMYFYNRRSRRCEQFIYGGCRGNENRFGTFGGCMRACSMSNNGGNGGNPNGEGFESGSGISSVVICSLPPAHGPCRGYFPRYYHNTTTKTCEQFIYGGCAGNPNNFETLAQCNSACASAKNQTTETSSLSSPVFLNPTAQNSTGGLPPPGRAKLSVCFMGPDPGPCRGYFPMYFYNGRSRRCERFIYGGCRGNGNRFWTFGGCMSTCG